MRICLFVRSADGRMVRPLRACLKESRPASEGLSRLMLSACSAACAIRGMDGWSVRLCAPLGWWSFLASWTTRGRAEASPQRQGAVAILWST